MPRSRRPAKYRKQVAHGIRKFGQRAVLDRSVFVDIHRLNAVVQLDDTPGRAAAASSSRHAGASAFAADSPFVAAARAPIPFRAWLRQYDLAE
jgi:hypothetical protein